MILLLLALTTQLSSSTGGSWVDGPAAPTSTDALPPAVAPRDGEPGTSAPQEMLVVPPVPAEDPRVVVDDGLLPALPERRMATVFERRDLARQAPLDLDTFFGTSMIPGLWWLPAAAGRSLPSARGLAANEVAVVVDDVPLLDGAGLVSLTESLGLLGAARLRFQHGPRADSASAAASGGVLSIDTGGDLDDVGESLRLDGLLGLGDGGPDNEKGGTTLVRSGWRRLRVSAHATVLHRENFRTGRVTPFFVDTPPAIEPDSFGSATLQNSGGVGGSAGARVDVVPLAASRLFVSWQAGRSLDTGDPARCSLLDDNGQALDCLRTKERGTDVVIAGFDLLRPTFGLRLQPSVRLHIQRSVDDVEHFGSALASVDTAKDEVFRGGARVALAGRAGAVQLLDQFEPSFVVALDAFADRFASSFFSRSLGFRDAEPAGPGIALPLRQRFVDGAVVSQALLSATGRVDGQLLGLWAIGRLAAQNIDSPSLPGRFEEGLHDAALLPGGELGTRVHLLEGLDLLASLGHLAHADDARFVLRGPDPVDATLQPAAPGAFSESFGELGLSASSAAIDVDALVWGARRSGAPDRFVEGDRRFLQRRPDVGAVGAEARATLRPGLEGLSAQAVLAAVVADESVFSALAEPQPGVVQPQAGLELRYAPASWPTGFFVRVQGAVPQNRLSSAEANDPLLCPERVDGVQERPCSGAPGFASADLGVWLVLGQLRFDVVGENLGDAQGLWRGAALGTGGTALRARVAFLF